MKILLTEEEMQNVVATLGEEDIKLYSFGEYKKWIVTKTEEGYALDYKYDEQGNIKEEYRKKSKSSSSLK